MMNAKERLEYFKSIAEVPATMVIYLVKNNETGDMELDAQSMILTQNLDGDNISLLEDIMSNPNFVGFGDEPHVKDLLDSIDWSLPKQLENIISTTPE
jgi:hypothetical protein